MRIIVMRIIPLLLLAAPVFAEEVMAEKPPQFSAPGFSIAFPEGWKAKKITEGMISAATTPDAPKQASAEIYYGTIPANATDADKNKFHALQKKHSVYDYVSKKDIRASKHHSPVTVNDLGNGITMQQVDVERLQRKEGAKGKQPVCSFYREYHTPQVELHLTYAQRGNCNSTKTDFDSFSKMLVWN